MINMLTFLSVLVIGLCLIGIVRATLVVFDWVVVPVVLGVIAIWGALWLSL